MVRRTGPRPDLQLTQLIFDTAPTCSPPLRNGYQAVQVGAGMVPRLVPYPVNQLPNGKVVPTYVDIQRDPGDPQSNFHEVVVIVDHGDRMRLPGEPRTLGFLVQLKRKASYPMCRALAQYRANREDKFLGKLTLLPFHWAPFEGGLNGTYHYCNYENSFLPLVMSAVVGLARKSGVRSRLRRFFEFQRYASFVGLGIEHIHAIPPLVGLPANDYDEDDY